MITWSCCSLAVEKDDTIAAKRSARNAIDDFGLLIWYPKSRSPMFVGFAGADGTEMCT